MDDDACLNYCKIRFLCRFVQTNFVVTATSTSGMIYSARDTTWAESRRLLLARGYFRRVTLHGPRVGAYFWHGDTFGA